MRSALSGASATVTKVPAVGVKLERQVRVQGIDTVLLCDRRGRMIRFETRTGTGTPEWEAWLADVLRAYGNASGHDVPETLSTLKEEAWTDLEEKGPIKG
jgi:hypothetical protein